VQTTTADAAPSPAIGHRLGRSIVVPIALAACFAAECLWFVRTQSLTYDEPVHVIAGLDAWHGRFDRWNDQPPLGRLLLTAPLRLTPSRQWQLENLGPSGANYWTISVEPDPVALAVRTRWVNVALGLALAALLWFTARRLFSESAAHFAVALFAASPALVAHFSLATDDGLATLLCFAVAVAVVHWRARPSWARTVVVGVALGGFLAAKFSAPPLVLLALVVMVASGPARKLGGRGAKAVVAMLVAALVVWGTYGWRIGPVTFRNGSLAGPYARDGSSVVLPVTTAFRRTVVLPAPEFFIGLGGVGQHAVRGQPAFLLGEVARSGGWRGYFPIVVLLKWPLAVWILAAVSLALIATRALALPGELPVLMLFPLVFFALAMATSLDAGDRYVLPVYPFLLLLAAAVWDSLRARSALRWLAIVLVVWQAADLFRYAPDYLAYLNAFVPSDREYAWLSDSNVDWGQGLIALRDYERAHPARPIALAYFGGVDPQSYGIRFRPLGEKDRVHGTVVVSATHLSGQYLRNPSAYRWLLDQPRTAILDHTLYVFEVP
jgi:hypothetical protein